MTRSAVLLCAALAHAAKAAPAYPAADTQQLIEAALAPASFDARSGKRKVCVQRKFQPPLVQTSLEWQTSKRVPPEWYAPINPWNGSLPHKITPQRKQHLQQALKQALAGQGKVAQALAIESVPAPLILDSSKRVQQSECEREMPRGLDPPKPNGPEEVSLSRPVFVDGFAFIEYANSCGGLCYGSFLKAFEKRNGRWTYIAETGLAVG